MSPSTELLIRKLYHLYRHTSDNDQKGLFFSQRCMQICRPIPTFAATTRQQIVQYLKDAEMGKIPVEEPSTTQPNDTSEGRNNHSSAQPKFKPRNFYTIRPLIASEFEFSTPDITSAIKLTPAELHQQAVAGKWIGMRVDLWDEGKANEGLLVKVQYWWRQEEVVVGEEMEGDGQGKGWRQCLHDIVYLGPRDGTEGTEGDILE
jgi:hypothetical protein